jgi:hypothetical protein
MAKHNKSTDTVVMDKHVIENDSYHAYSHVVNGEAGTFTVRAKTEKPSPVGMPNRSQEPCIKSPKNGWLTCLIWFNRWWTPPQSTH